MHVLQGGLGPGKGAKTLATADGKVGDVKHYNPAGFARRRPEAAPFQERSFAERPPRTDGGSSELVILDGEGVIVAVNRTWRATIAAYGFVLRNAGIGAPYVDVACRFLPDLDRAALELSLRQLLSGGAEDVRHTYAIRTARGPRWRQVQITHLTVGAVGRFVAIHDDLTDLAMTQEALHTASEQLITARDEERQRIALELHDSTSQHLAAISLGLARLKRASTHRMTSTIIDEISRSVNEAVKETRVISYLMNPRDLVRGGLSAAARGFLEGFTQRSGLAITLDADEAVDGAPAPVQHAALRIMQEALSNAYRHARARRVSVELTADERRITVSISDDGCGMASANGGPVLGVGIPGMHARAEQLSGRLDIASDESGTRVVAEFPLA